MTQEKAQVIKASKALQFKAGSGSIDGRVLERAQKKMDQNATDFTPLAKELLGKIQAGIDNCKQHNKTEKPPKSDIVNPLMDLKANARMFKYPVVSDTAGVLLMFLEKIDIVDKDALTITELSMKSFQMVIDGRILPDDERTGAALCKELDQACKRYYARHTCK